MIILIKRFRRRIIRMIVQDRIRRVNKVMTIIKRNDKKRIINL